MTFRTDRSFNLNSTSDSLQPFGTETGILIPETDILPCPNAQKLPLLLFNEI